MAPPNATANDLEPDKGQEESIRSDSSVNNFQDIEDPSNIKDPNYWAYRQLFDLVKKHGCVAGFPDGTFQGDQPATRFEVANLVKACLDSGISIHEENRIHHMNNTSTSHSHEPAEHEHGTVAEHEHPIDPSGHKHENIAPHPHEPAEHEHPIDPSGHKHEDIVPHPHEPAEHEHKTVADHEHSISLYILISIIAFIIYQLFVLMKIRKLEKDVEEISRNRKPTLKDLVVLAAGIISIIAAIIPIVNSYLGTEGQEAGWRPVQDEMALREDTDSLVPPPAKTNSWKAGWRQYSPYQEGQLKPGSLLSQEKHPHQFLTNPSLPRINGPPAG